MTGLSEESTMEEILQEGARLIAEGYYPEPSEEVAEHVLQHIPALVFAQTAADQDLAMRVVCRMVSSFERSPARVVEGGVDEIQEAPGLPPPWRRGEGTSWEHPSGALVWLWPSGDCQWQDGDIIYSAPDAASAATRALLKKQEWQRIQKAARDVAFSATESEELQLTLSRGGVVQFDASARPETNTTHLLRLTPGGGGGLQVKVAGRGTWRDVQ